MPDSFLTSNGFRTDAGALYSPASYAGKALDGLFFAAVEKTGHLIAYALGGSDAMSNLTTACAHCNQSRGSRQRWDSQHAKRGTSLDLGASRVW